MPTYDYQCDACGNAWELFQKITDEPERRCPACRKLKARRLFGTGAAVVFKGSGFYQTDYRSDSYKQGEKAAKAASDPKTETGSAGKSEPKPEKSSVAADGKGSGKQSTAGGDVKARKRKSAKTSDE
jgi:putative FmdB family regulatory protein